METEQRLEKLRQYLKEEDGGDINKSSLNDFRKLLNLIDDHIQDKLEITLTSDNKIYVSYDELDNERIALYFFGGREIFLTVIPRSKPEEN